MTGLQWKVARLGIGWTQEELAGRARVSRKTVSALEGEDHDVLDNNRKAILEALERGGVSFSSTEETVSVTFQRGVAGAVASAAEGAVASPA